MRLQIYTKNGSGERIKTILENGLVGLPDCAVPLTEYTVLKACL